MRIIEFFILLVLANAAPVVASRVLGARLAWPLDGGMHLADGQPLFGASKTLRGVLVAVVAAALGAVVMGLSWYVGALAGFTSMCGDLFSSFVKRRMKLAPSTRATVLDQVPESLLPLLACQPLLDLTAVDILVVVLLFLVGDILFSPLFYRLKIRKRPY